MGLIGFDSKMKRNVSMPSFENAARKIRFSNFQLAKITTLLLRNRSLVDYTLSRG